MLINNLPPRLKELAKRRLMEQNRYNSNREEEIIVNEFHWASTPEGSSYWNYVDRNGNDDDFFDDQFV